MTQRNNFRFLQAIPFVLIILLINISCSILPKKRCWKDGYIQHDSTWFPHAQLDFSPVGYQARLALPAGDTTRIWVKGSDKTPFVRIFSVSGSALSEKIQLEPPYYTAIIPLRGVKEETIKIRFHAEIEMPEKNSKEKTISLTKINRQNTDKFSFMVYGCFQPFIVNEAGAPLLLHDAANPLNREMRDLFRKVGMERSVSYYPDGEDSLTQEVLVTNPVLAIGTGDQVYVDAGYEKTDFRKHALSGWAHGCKDPYPLLNANNYEGHLDRCYRNFFSFQCFDSVFSAIPLISVWDDHEIRDGWGSHGDEYSKRSGNMSPELEPFFNISKSAYLAHQFSPSGAEVRNAITDNKSLEQELSYFGVPIFAFDLRSNRDIHRDQAIDEVQMARFKAWCQNLEDSSEVLLVSSMPFFYKPAIHLKLLARLFQPGLRDDINDGWYSKYNEGQRNEIMQELINLRNRNIKPIILSGDAHLGGMISAWYSNPDGKRKRLCYELIYSGLSHEALGEARQGFVINLRERNENSKKNDPTFPVNEYNVDYIYEFVQGRLNFGALQFEKGKNTTASLFIVGSDEEFLTEREMVLNWEETYEEYLEKAERINKSSFSPPELSTHRIVR